MKRLYMIRLENGNGLILQATNREQALRDAGLRVDPAKQAAAMRQADVATVHLGLVREGLGPQNYTIRELHHFLCNAQLEDDGDFHFVLESGDGSDEFYQDYPHLCEAEAEHLRRKFADPTFENPEVRSLYREAVEKERVRLLGAPLHDVLQEILELSRAWTEGRIEACCNLLAGHWRRLAAVNEGDTSRHCTGTHEFAASYQFF